MIDSFSTLHGRLDRNATTRLRPHDSISKQRQRSPYLELIPFNLTTTTTTITTVRTTSYATHTTPVSPHESPAVEPIKWMGDFSPGRGSSPCGMWNILVTLPAPSCIVFGTVLVSNFDARGWWGDSGRLVVATQSIHLARQSTRNDSKLLRGRSMIHTTGSPSRS